MLLDALPSKPPLDHPLEEVPLYAKMIRLRRSKSDYRQEKKKETLQYMTNKMTGFVKCEVRTHASFDSRA